MAFEDLILPRNVKQLVRSIFLPRLRTRTVHDSYYTYLAFIHRLQALL
jgi:hypothetical protein